MSEVGWLDRDLLILTINNHFYLVNLKQEKLFESCDKILYGMQQ